MRRSPLLPRPARAVALLALVGLALSACSSSSNHNASGTTSTIGPKVTNAATIAADATRGIHGARLSGTITDGKGHTGTVTGTWAGSPTAGGKGDVLAHIPVGNSLGEVEIRWTDGSVYVRRAVAQPALVTNTLLLPLFRTGGQQPWARGSAKGIGVNFITNPFDPPALLDLIGEIGTPIKSSATLAGKRVTVLKSSQPVLTGLWTGATVRVYVDDQNRAVRVEITSPTGGTTYNLSGFGATLDVAVPSASEIASATNARIKLATGFQAAAHGTSMGVVWRLLAAPTTDGQICWRWDAHPAIRQVDADGPQNSRCITPPANDAPLDETLRFAVQSDGTGSYNVLAVLMPYKSRAVDLGFIGGGVVPQKPADPFVWVGPTSKTPGYLGITLPNGSRLDCGAGSISSIADLKDSSLTSHASTEPWTCAPA